MRDGASRFRRAPTRQRIIQAATEAAATYGYLDLSVAQVTERAGVSRSTFYEHFSGREDCFLAALDFLGGELINRLEAVESADSPGTGPLIEALCQQVGDDPVGSRVLFMESLAAGAESMDFRDRLQHRVAVLIAIASQTGEFDERAVPAALDDLVGGLFRLFAMRLRHDRVDGAGELEPADLAAWVDSYAGALTMPSRQPFANLVQRNARPTETYELKPLPAGRHRLTEAEVEVNQRLRIFSALTSLSYASGFAQTSVAEITPEARVSRNAFYRHFRNKGDAANQALELMLEQVIGACASAFTSAASWPEQVWRASQAFASFFATATDYAYLGLVETHVVGNEMVHLIYDRLGAFTLFLEEGYRWRPQAQTLPRISSEAIGATMYEIAFRALRKRHPPEWYSEFLPQFVFICLAPFMGHDAAMKFLLEQSRKDAPGQPAT
jgi:AcrR family transcriptional regulator